MKPQKAVSRRTAWTNLLVCGGISWGVNIWHALNTTIKDDRGHVIHTDTGVLHISPTLALLYGTAPVVVSAFQSHNIAHAGGKWFKKILTFAVFALGMALSINAQAAAVAPIAGGILKWVFPVMLDLSAFMALHSIMTPSGTAKTSSETPSVEHPSHRPPTVSSAAAGPSVELSVPPSAAVSPAPPRDRLPELPAGDPHAPGQTPEETPKQGVAEPSKAAPKPRRTAAKRAVRTPAADTRERARQLLKDSPDMTGADLARRLGKAPDSGHVRMIRAQIRAEMDQASGAAPADPAPAAHADR